MSTVKQLAEEISQGLNQALPNVNKPVVRKLSLAVGAMIEGRTPNTAELSNLLPLEIDRQDLREQWLRRLLSSPALSCETVIALGVRRYRPKSSKFYDIIVLMAA